MKHKHGIRRLLTATLAAALAAAGMGAAPAPQAAAAAYAGYLFVHFRGEGLANSEQIYYSLSKGNDPLNYTQQNGGKPVLASTVGTKGVRDPFIVRSPQGDRFFLIGTDQRQYGSSDWDTPQRKGSKSIVVWESTDLVRWTNQRLVKVAPDTAGNVWAPEATYDAVQGKYVVYWASKIYAANDPDHTGTTHNRMLYATTSDFRTFSAAKTWKDPGYSVIDSTVIKNGNTYYRYSKDERDPSSSSPCAKYVLAEKSTFLLNTGFGFVSDCIGKGTISRGEGPLVFKSNSENKWYLFIDEYSGRGYVPFETSDLNSGRWIASANYSLPGSPRHGTVLPVTRAEYDRLTRQFG
ncbi:glycoside hydrolase family 43 protein [Lentzea sp. JNUCC 0626]|uniref:glycoside hydrolase family 43 protein n=1 Tax=Lentzea sp. JNUCC 0626 TaxID=3367513 RepID=UPI00374A499D